MTLSPTSAAVLAALRVHAEGDLDDGWATVYLDNASSSLTLSAKSFRSALAILSREGLYRVVDGYAWGKVKMEHVICS